MNLNELVLAAIVALPFELAVHAGWDYGKRRRKEIRIKNKYHFLARRYKNLRDGKTPTGGSVELTQNKNGTFQVVGLHADGSTEWEGELRMSTEEEDIGTATYRYLLRTEHGTQRVVYVPYRDALHVVGMNQSTTEHKEFVHVWEPEIHVGKLLT